MGWRKLTFGISVATYALLIRPQLLRLGASAQEAATSYPGDSYLPQVHIEATHAISVAAPRSAVWPWLAQMGRERTGFYGIDRLENWRIPSVTYIRQDIPALALGTMLDNGLKVLDFVAEQYLVIGGFDMPNDLGGRSDITYAYCLASPEPDTTRLVIRMRTFTEGFAGWLYNRAFEVLDVWMMHARLKGIRERAERMVHPIEYETVPLADLAPTGPIASSENRS